ncbi:tetratricopeptide repeat protein [Streptomyces prasinus]|uniref:Tetratricopeptide repeat protein n=1 Tax=Streptomyces prasinus TaxID=67345 RepID=A0ABX6AZ70_9ACTN|nr:tetratricopeptide repeat protein [Streptomyces prasinus]QEV07774.1 tetratricopeptide repeat protein [Streptomyces prasinus]
MARLSREKKQEQQQAAHAAHLAARPIDVHVPAAVEGGAGTRRASVGGVLVIAGLGEEVQQAVLNRLHRIAVASGHAVLATIRDERIGYVVPLQVDPDGGSRFTGEPAPMTPESEPESRPGSEPRPGSASESESDRDTARRRPVAAPHDDGPPLPAAPAAVPPPRPGHDRPTHFLRPVPDPTPASTSAPGSASAPGSVPAPAPASIPAPDAAPGLVRGSAAFRPWPVPGAAGATPPGTVAPPTGEFGPPPSMDARPHPVPEAGGPCWTPPTPPRHPAPLLPPADRIPSPPPATADPAPEAVRPRTTAPRPKTVHGSSSGSGLDSGTGTGTGTGTVSGIDSDPKPAPPRGFDAVAEALLADEPSAAPGETHLADPVGRINDAVRAGRIDTAARLAGETVAEASRVLGPEHPEVLRLRELTAYVAYLGDEPLHAFRLSLELAGVHRRAGDAEAAYGNVRSAATAWRAVRDPLRGLELGRDLIALWTALAAEDGPAADEIEELDSARARMGRLTDRARAQHG